MALCSGHWLLVTGHCFGAIAQLGERVLCKHEVVGSIPSGSTRRLIGGRFRDVENDCSPPGCEKSFKTQEFRKALLASCAYRLTS